MKSPYTIWAQTPLKWHKFITYVALPIHIIVLLPRIPSIWSALMDLSRTGMEWVGLIDAICAFLSLGLCVGAIWGNLARNHLWSGPLCVIGLYLLETLYSAFIAILSLLLHLGETEVWSYAVHSFSYLIGSVLVFVYYRKRRLLFRPMPSASRHQTAAAHVSLSSTSTPPEDPWEQAAPSSPERRVYSPLDPPEPRTPHYAPLWLVVLLGVLCLLLGFLCLTAGSRAYRLAEENIDLKARVADYVDTIDHKNERFAVVRKSLEDALDRIQWLEDELDFWNFSAVIVTESGTKYHHHGCPHISGRDYYIYNVELAKYYGYEPCQTCFS